MITYNKLWNTMKEKGVSQYCLIKDYGVSAGQIGRLKKNGYVSTHTLERLCEILKCNIEDIVEYTSEQ
ncbi:MAG: helix-turn-helix transcriptional regulator [Lacrimispora sp.]|uniref:helix-turn-helix domain-containing protein n=1 Tax=Lacrimispora sp. TaxID=2719234 RepID=UPI0039E3EF6A